MDYEKAYKETIGKLRKLHNDWDSTQNRAAKEIELAFPELCESEDELIKGCIGMCLTDATEQRFEEFNTTLKDCLAWLEKQKHLYETTKDRFYREGFEEGRLYERQFEPKHIECIKFTNEFENQVSHLIASVLNREYEYNDGFVKYAAQSLLEYAKKEQSHADKIEPKFNVGDIISNGDSEVEIVSIDKNKYYVTNGEIENDANICNWVIYFKVQENWKLVDKSYSEENENLPNQSKKWTEEDSRILHNVKAYIGYAAGQRGVKDELFKEANEWLDSLPIGFIHNENYNEDMVALLIDELKQIANRNNAPEQYKMEIDWLKSLRPHLKQEWSEDDEKMLASFLHKVEVCDLLSNKEIAWIRKKLKSVKPQFHWKSSEAKNETKNECPNYSEGYGCSTSPLKQCDTCPAYKLYNHWKPSEEQMEALDKAKNCPANYYNVRLTLESLYNDLKKF